MLGRLDFGLWPLVAGQLPFLINWAQQFTEFSI